MVQPIMKDRFFLSQKSVPATPDDIQVAQDLLDTLAAHRDGCVGMAANMIGIAKRIIVFTDDGNDMVMFNPELVKTSEPYETEEGCLSLEGIRPTTRYRKITVRYQNAAFQSKQRTFRDWTAQIIQHEIDHCNGILI
jgi:peptide deformylase